MHWRKGLSPCFQEPVPTEQVPGRAATWESAFTISDPSAQAEVQALRDAYQELTDDVRALTALVHALRGALVAVGVVKGGA